MGYRDPSKPTRAHQRPGHSQFGHGRRRRRRKRRYKQRGRGFDTLSGFHRRLKADRFGIKVANQLGPMFKKPAAKSHLAYHNGVKLVQKNPGLAAAALAGVGAAMGTGYAIGRRRNVAKSQDGAGRKRRRRYQRGGNIFKKLVSAVRGILGV